MIFTIVDGECNVVPFNRSEEYVESVNVIGNDNCVNDVITRCVESTWWTWCGRSIFFSSKPWICVTVNFLDSIYNS